MQFRVIVATDPQTHTQTGPITVHCAAAASAQCNYNRKQLKENRNPARAAFNDLNATATCD